MSFAPLRLRCFRRLLFSYWVNQFGDYAAEIALAVAVYSATGSAVAVAATWLAHRCLLGLFAPLAVARLERLPAQRLLAGIYVAQGALFLTLAVVAGGGLIVVLPLVALDGLLAPTARAIARSALVSVTRPAGLHRDGNALVNVVFTFNCVAAPAAGGLMVACVGPHTALVLNAATFALAAVSLAGCSLPRAADDDHESGVSRLREALAYVRERPALRGLLLNDAAFTLFVQAIIPIEVVFVTGTLHGSEAAFGAVVTAWGAGMILGGMISTRCQGATMPAVLLLTAGLQAGACLGMGFSATVATVVVWSVFGGVGNGVYAMAFVTAYQERTDDAFQARVNGLYEALVTVGPGIGFIAGGALAALASPRSVYLFAGLGALAVMFRAATTLRRADWSVPEPATLTPTPAAA